jgi:cellulose synthase/poly-beta-1,6-N-acetylglucosamine synthase-like glycosyltransferase
MEHPLYIISGLLITATYIRSLLNLLNLSSNLKWIINKNRVYKRKSNQAVSEKYIICIPMLREQRVVAETLKYFSQLNYPYDKYRIVVVTTHKEIADKIIKAKQLIKAARDISDGKTFQSIQKKHLGLLPSGQLEVIYRDNRNKNYRTVLKNLKSTYAQIPTTFDLATKEAKSINSKFKRNFVMVMHYPHKEGVMSHQINYVIRKLAKSRRNTNSIFAVYNADSRPNSNTLKYVTYALKEFEEETGIKPNIVQQSSLFTINYNNFPSTITGYSLKAASLFQTKWTLVRELSRFRSQSTNVVKLNNSFISKLLNTKISHCVGHGLFVRFGLLSNEYLPTETINEDLPFGYYQCCKREPILPLPILENSEVPESLKSLINQKRFWFTPYLQYLNCRDRVLRLKTYHSRLEVEILTAQAELTGFIWLLQSFVLFLPIIIGIYLHSLLIILMWIVGLLFYWFIPIRIIYTALGKLENIAGRSTSKTNLLDYLFTSFFGLYILLTHSIGPILCVRDFALAKFINKPIIKLKTER